MSSSSSTSNSTSSSRRGRRSRGYDVVSLRFNPTNDAILSVYVAGSIFPCIIPPVSPGPLPTPTPTPVPNATEFMACLLSYGFEYVGDPVALTPTDVLVILTRD